MTTLQIQQLYFPGIRSAQMRLHYLAGQGLVFSWPMVDPPGLTRRPSLLLLAPRGARLLGELHGHSPGSYVRRAMDARDHCWHVTHDLEANGFFIDLARASRLHLEEGLLQWTGEESCRSIRRAWARDDRRRPVATPDGAGLYLHRGRTIWFDLEWDRGTESIARLQGKLRTYCGFYKDVRNADRHHVLFVLHRAGREERLQELIGQAPGVRRRRCRFWTTTVDRIDRDGPLGALWADAEPRRPPDDVEANWEPARAAGSKPPGRLCLSELPPLDTSPRTIADCIGRGRWWETRPGGGEVV